MAATETLLGIDLGIASCGWAVIETDDDGEGKIVKLGVWMFDAPETPDTQVPTNEARRLARGMRRVTQRRRQRMNEVRRLFREYGLIESQGKDALWIKDADGTLLNPWSLRAKGLDHSLTGQEFAVALGHIAKHRGFKSNSKRDRGANAPKDAKDFYKGIEEVRTRLEASRSTDAPYRTVGEMFAKDDEFAARKRNRDGKFTRSILRQDQEEEVRELFRRQRAVGNGLASVELEDEFLDMSIENRPFHQRALQDSEHMVGPCPFEKGERRASRRSWSFELFRLLAKLTTLRVREGADERPLRPEEMSLVESAFGRQATISVATVRKLIGLTTDHPFVGLKREEEKDDIVAGKGAAEGAAALRSVVIENAGGVAWGWLADRPEIRDEAAFVITFREDADRIQSGLEALGLPNEIASALMIGVKQGRFSRFKGAGHISAKAARAMIPHLRQGLTYDKAAKEAGYDHAADPVAGMFDTEGQVGAQALRAILRSGAIAKIAASPVTRKALTEALKQVVALVEEFGVPGKIHVELAREVGKSQEKREEIRSGQERRRREKQWLESKFEEDVGRPPAGVEEMLRYELWREQNHRCLYTDTYISPNQLVATDNSVQVDHILPWSRCADDSPLNKTLCLAKPNQDKRRGTPYEWFGENEERWAAFTAAVEGLAIKRVKKRRYLLKDAKEVEDKFKRRNLNDTQFATRLLLRCLALMYPKGEQAYEVPRPGEPEKGKRRVSARPGALTDRLRRGWGIQDLKKTEEGARRSDDRHHALDALICAAMTESALQRLTRAWQLCEERGSHRDFENLDPPWPGFMEEARSKLREVFVARAERHRARGKAHDATVKQVRELNGEAIVYERKPIEKLTERDLDRIPVPEPHGKVVDPKKLRDELVASLRQWIAAGKPKAIDKLPRSPKGDIVRKVRIATTDRPAVLLRGGTVDRGDMARIDVFENGDPKRRSRYLFVPVYNHQITENAPPDRAITLRKPYQQWRQIQSSDLFLFSLGKLCFVEIGHGVASPTRGYFRSVDSNDGRVSVTPHHSNSDVGEKRVSPTTIGNLRKFAVDRLGRISEVKRELRTWRGKVCI